MTNLAVEPSKITNAEMLRRREALSFAKAHSRIEGQYPSAEGSKIFDAFVRGDIEEDEILPRLRALRRHIS